MKIAPYILLIALLAACNTGNTETENQSAKTEEVWAQQFEAVEKKATECKKEPCTKVTLHIPVLDGGSTGARSNINRHIDEYLREAMRTRLPEPEGNTPLAAMAESFIEGYELYVLEFPESREAWFFEANGAKSFLAAEYYTLDFLIADYMGGAHPNTYRYLQSFDLSTGDPIEIAERYDMAALSPIAEKAFRAHHKLAPDANLDDAGFFFEEGKFTLPANMALSEKGLMLLYNPYEVAAYALGETEIYIPYGELIEI